MSTIKLSDALNDIANVNKPIKVGGVAGNRIEVYDENQTTLRDFVDNNGFKQVRYRDEYVGGEWVDAVGGAAPDEGNVTIGGITFRALFFDGGNTEERKTNSFELAHDIDFEGVNDGTYAIEWHVHYAPTTNDAGNVKWFLDYVYMPVNAAPIPQTSVSFVDAIPANTQHFHSIGGLELPVPTGGFGVGDLILFSIRRTPTDAQDTYASDVILFKTALHIPINDFGSRQRYQK